ncbi:MAG: hypothetical protein OER21_13590 [Gemmatimonadota bacterium]|nr:hypothetical protein [Gemmatimonadota bacterium]
MPTLHALGLASLLALAGCGGQTDRPADTGQPARAGTLDASQVPEALRSLIPIALEWGIGDDVDRNRKVDAASPEARERLRQALAPHQARITAWLDSFGQDPMSDEAAAFMYAQLALDEIDASEGR